jgi:rare lipoprotein A
MFQMRANIVSVGLFCVTAMLPLDLAKADQVGGASWYAFHSRTASGERMNPNALTAAHRSLPFGTKVLVENLSNGHSVTVTINDRGPFVKGKIIDLSKAAAASIGMSGVAKVRISTAGGGGGGPMGSSQTTRGFMKTAEVRHGSGSRRSYQRVAFNG